MAVVLNEQRSKVFLDRYAKKGPDGQPVEQTPEEMWDRVAAAIGQDHHEVEHFRELLDGFKFVPGGRILAGAGVDAEVTYYNCYVIPVETRVRRAARQSGDVVDSWADPGSDSREAIFDTIGLMVDIMSRGGGVGINWSVLRPSGAYLKRVNGTSSGPVGWMDVASKAVGEVEQGGSRRGAAMFMLDDWHPDVVKFIDAKRDYTRITNANVSVAVSDRFMAAVEADDVWEFMFPDTDHPAYNAEWDGDLEAWREKYGELAVKGYGTIKARELWRKLAEAAHASGEPGVVFLDRYNKESTAQGIERLISVNPCGEQGLGPYSVCNLGAMNLDAYIRRDQWEEITLGKGRTVVEGDYAFDYDSFRQDVKWAVRFLDNVIDLNYYFLPENEAIQKKLRRIGLSVMGLADALVALGFRYGSKDAVRFTEAVFSEMKSAAIEASNEIASEKGAAPAWHEDMVNRPYLRSIINRSKDPKKAEQRLREYGLRNLFLLTQAPTGTTSILAGVNSGIEPFFALTYTRQDRTGTHEVVVGAVEKYHTPGTVRGREWVTANEVTVEEHIAMQAAVQLYVDSSVSKTINGPNRHTVEDVEKAYTLAYKSGLKGLAYFRDGSGRAQVLYRDGVPSEANEELAKLREENDELRGQVFDLYEQLEESLDAAVEFTRPSILRGETLKVPTVAGTAYVTVNRDNTGKAREVFFNVGKAGSDITGMAEAMGRLASLALRKGATLGGVANQLEGVGGERGFQKPLAHALGQALSDINRASPVPTQETIDITAVVKEWFPASTPTASPYVNVIQPAGNLCPECGAMSLVREEGCQKCHACGFSAC